jgi:eukaryotic-like serine/threonine-protein kinase
MGSASTPSISQLWEGRTIDGKFALLEWLGGSPDCSVFVTLRQGAHRSAIKLILAEDSDAEAWLSLWEIARRLAHPNLMPVFETGRSSVDGAGLVYLVTECGDRVLSQFIQDRPLKLHEASNIVYPVADALSYLHAKGFVHGHVKPSNILVSGDQLKLSTDSFLVAAAVPTRLGKPGAFDAPELASGNLSPAADVWSLGATLIEALTQHPLVWDPAANTPPEVPQSLPLPFCEIVPECLRLDPASRCTLADIKARIVQPPAPASLPSADELVARLTQLHPPALVPPSSPAGPPPIDAEPTAQSPSARWKPEEPRSAPALHLFEEANQPRRSKLPLVLGILVLLALGGVVLALTGNLNLPPELAKYLPPSSPAASHPQPIPPHSTAASSPAPAQPSAQPSPQSGTPPAQATSQTAPSTPDSTPAATPPSSAAASNPGSDEPNSQLAAPATLSSDASTSPSTADSEPQPTLPQPEQKLPSRPRNAPGAVANRVLPAVSPEAADSMRASVLVVLRVTVNRNGSVADVSYVSPGPGNYFARVAQRAALTWKFDPPLRDGHAEPSVWRLRFFFARRDVDVTASEEDR